MSEIRENSENNKQEEIQKIDIMNLVAAFWNGFRKLWFLLAVIVVVCTLRSYFTTSFSYTPQYVATATVSVTTPGGSYSNISSAQEMASIFPYILTSGVLQDVIENDLGLTYLPGTISVDAEEEMNLMTISVSSDDPQMAYNILTSVIENYPEVAEYIFGETRLQILDETGIPSDTRRESVIQGSYKRGALQGILISAVILCLYVFLKRTVRTKDQVKRLINIQDLGSLPYVKQKKRKNAENNNINILDERISPSYEEAVRRLRIRLMKEMEMKDAQILMVTSSVPGEGKTTAAVNLAIALAKQKRSVILIDCDLRNPSDSEILKAGKEKGLAEYLTGELDLEECIQYGEKMGFSDLENFLYVSGGNADADSTELLDNPKMKELIDSLKDKAEYVILDSAPIGLLADAGILAQYVDGIVLVVKKDFARADFILNCLEQFAEHNVHIIGCVLNDD